jgi:hypothetical protein
MNGTHDTEPVDSDGGALDPRQAAELIEQTATRARRAFETSSPIAAGIGAGVFLFGYGAVWWSISGQHPYAGPALWAVIVLYGLILILAVVGRLLLPRPRTGVGGRARRQLLAVAAAVAAAGISAWMVEGALRFLGVSFEIVYGVYGPTVPLIALAAASTGFAASRDKWPELWLAIAVMLIAAGSTFFGPDGAWGLTGLGCAIALLVYAAIVTVRLRRAIRP